MTKIRALLKNKRNRWMAGGAGCLAAGVLILSLSAALGARAEELELGSTRLDFKTEQIDETTVVYLVENAAQLRELGNATSEQTRGKRFRLVKDITTSAAAAASGSFAGSFDGGGYVISYADVAITMTDETTGNETKSHGLLFGEIAAGATVENLILEIADADAFYTRKTMNQAVESVGTPVFEDTQKQILSEGETVSGLDADPAKAALAEQIAAMTAETMNGTEYRTHTLKEPGSVTTTYAEGPAGTDYFGLVSGQNHGTISEVYVTGHDVAITREELPDADASQLVQPGYRNETYRYQQSTDTETVNIDSQELRLDTHVYQAEQTLTEALQNGELTLSVSAVKAAEAGDDIVYTVTVQNQSTTVYQKVNLSASVAGSWQEENSSAQQTAAEGVLQLGEVAASGSTGAVRTLTFTCSTDGTSEDSVEVDFTLEGINGAEAGSSTKNVSLGVNAVTTRLYEASTGSYTYGGAGAGISLAISAPEEAARGDKLTYTIDVTNTSQKDYHNVTLTASQAGDWSGDSVSPTTAQTKLDLGAMSAGASCQITFVKTASATAASEKISFSTGGAATLSGGDILDNVPVLEAGNIKTTLHDASLQSRSQNLSGLQMQITAPASVAKSGEEEEIQYEITVTNTGDRNYTGLVLSASESGKWGGLIGSTGTSKTIGRLSAGNKETVRFTVEAADTVALQFGLEGTSNTGSTEASAVTLGIFAVETLFFDAGAQSVTKDMGNGLQATLAVVQKGLTVATGAQFDYTLTLENTNAEPAGAMLARDILITTDLSDWSVSAEGTTAGAFAIGIGSQTIPAGCKVVLTGSQTVDSTQTEAVRDYQKAVSIVGSLQSTAYKYVYAADQTQLGDFQAEGEVIASGAAVAYGNLLYAGGIAGRSSGTIQSVKQAANLTAAVNDELIAGGIAGTADGTLKDLYLTGRVNTSASYIGAGSAVPAVSAATEQEAAALAAVSSNTGWTSYKRYEVSGSGETVSCSIPELSWLTVESAFIPGIPRSGIVALTVSDEKDIRKAELTQEVTYKARKSMTQESEELIHVDSRLDLGESAFYDLINTYATDGYYHYWFDSSAQGLQFPYDNNSNPYGDADQFTGSIERRNSADGLYDVVVVGIPTRSAAYNHNDVVYYTANVPTTQADAMLPMVPDGETYFEADIMQSGNNARAELLFSIPEAKYGITVYAGGHIYPMVATDEFGPSARGALEAPQITVFDFYDVNDRERTFTELTAGARYEAGSSVKLVISEDAASYAPSFEYAVVQTAPDTDSWEAVSADRTPAVSRLKAGKTSGISYAEMDNEEFRLPDTAGENYYLYIKAESKYHTTVEYCYTYFDLVQKSLITSAVYGVEKDSVPAGEQENFRITGSEIMEGDFLYLTEAEDAGMAGDQTLLLESMQYIISSRRITDFAGYTWTEHTADTPISLNRQMDSTGMLFVYARRYAPSGSSSVYGEISEWMYTFAKNSAEVRANPPTIAYQSVNNINIDAAATVAHNASILLYTGADATQIYYVKSDDPETVLQIERIGILPEKTDGAYPEGYYVDGSRCFYISDGTNPAVHFEQEIVPENKTREEKEFYLSTVAFETGHNSSTIVNYAYKVGAQQQVAAPESALVTNRVVNGKETEGERADISRGATLFFTSMTPNAQLYYWIGNKADGAGTKYENGVKVITTEPAYVITLMAKDPNGILLDSETVTFVYNIADAQLTDAPVATPVTSDASPAVVIPGDKILLSSPTTGAVIYYALDGKEPLLEEDIATGEYKLVEGMIYDPAKGITMPSDKSGFLTVSAVAVKPGLAPSSMVHLIYAYPSAVQAPYASMNSGYVNMNAQVELKNRTDGATIYYTVSSGDSVSGGDAVPEDPTIFSSIYDDENPFVITEKTTIKAFAVKDRVHSDIVTFTYTPYAVLAAPAASIGSGSMVSAGTILTLQAAEGATVYYTTDGSDPTEAGSSTVITGTSLILNGAGGSQITVKAYAAKEGSSRSDVVTFTYLISQNPGGITADVEVGSLIPNHSKVNLMTDVTGAVIYYTTNGDSPVDHGILGSAVTVSGTPGNSFTIKAVAMLNGIPGNVVSFTYRIREIPNTPSAVPSGGVLTEAARVSLNSNVEKIYYTTDGSTPTKSSTPYTEPILINRTTTLKTIAVSEEGEISAVGTYTYVAAARAAAVESSVADGTVLKPGDTITLSTATRNAVIYYSTNGTEPTMENLEHMLVYNGDEIVIDRSVTIYAVAYREGLRLSEAVSWNYTVDVIPAVEQKKEEEAKKAEEGLRDSDISGLERNTDEEKTGVKKLLEKEYHTMVSYDAEALPAEAVLETVKQENSDHVIQQVKGILGEESTVLETYQFKVKSGSFTVQPRETVEIAVPIPEGYEEAVLTIASVGDIYNLTTLETRREADMLYAKADKLGNYVVIGPERESTEAEKIPYLLLAQGAAGAALLGGLVFSLKVLWEKWCRRRKNYPKE